ncbi:M57 family metalloprotease [Lapidilactobacillus dextrinicus]|uniref:M57 family metalloprotease n=1 Tax=Lapidilactobacillus dextrinicus TaxID=51664 RepID=UPI000A6BFC76|nr:M57 family metalloprotease [Lapidilactobacillus dextrinicus]
MKFKSGVALVILIAGGYYLYHQSTEPQAEVNVPTSQAAQTTLQQVQAGALTLKDKLASMLDWSQPEQATSSKPASQDASTKSTTSTSSDTNQTSSSSVAEKNSDSTTTPIESIVKGQPLANTYTYSFSNETSSQVRQVFLEAVAAYNQTDIVKLTPGTQTEDHNHITFSVYEKTMDNPSTLELGVGGPKIIQKYSLFQSQSVNHATANINITYQVAIAKSVAMHELGHALGLDHSQQLSSIMYPVDQGMTSLSTADLTSLQEIY